MRPGRVERGNRGAASDLAPSAATLRREMASDCRDGHAQRHEGSAERDHRAPALPTTMHNPSPSSLPAHPVPGFPAKATSTAAQLSPDAMTTTCRWPGPPPKRPDRGVTRCQRHSPSLSASDCLDLQPHAA